MLLRLYEPYKNKYISSNGGVIVAKKKVYIPQFFKRDRDGMVALTRVGIVRIEDLKKHCNLVDSRIKNWIRDGYAEKIIYEDQNELREALLITDKGKELVRKQWGITRHYNAQTQSPYHDLALSDKYFSLSEQVRETWITESQIRDQFVQILEDLHSQGKHEQADTYYDMMKKGFISMPDGAYEEEGRIVMYEIITDSYSRQTMLAKEMTAEIMGYVYASHRI